MFIGRTPPVAVLDFFAALLLFLPPALVDLLFSLVIERLNFESKSFRYGLAYGLSLACPVMPPMFGLRLFYC